MENSLQIWSKTLRENPFIEWTKKMLSFETKHYIPPIPSYLRFNARAVHMYEECQRLFPHQVEEDVMFLLNHVKENSPQFMFDSLHSCKSGWYFIKNIEMLLEKSNVNIFEYATWYVETIHLWNNLLDGKTVSIIENFLKLCETQKEKKKTPEMVAQLFDLFELVPEPSLVKLWTIVIRILKHEMERSVDVVFEQPVVDVLNVLDAVAEGKTELLIHIHECKRIVGGRIEMTALEKHELCKSRNTPSPFKDNDFILDNDSDSSFNDSDSSIEDSDINLNDSDEEEKNGIDVIEALEELEAQEDEEEDYDSSFIDDDVSSNEDDEVIPVAVARETKPPKKRQRKNASIKDTLCGIDEVAKSGEPICSICMTNKIITIFLPCFHSCACLDCARKLKDNRVCPICQSVITTMSRTFMAGYKDDIDNSKE